MGGSGDPSLEISPEFIEGIDTGAGLIPNSWGEVGLGTMANLFSDAQGFWVSGADPLVASGNLIEKYGVTPEIANAAVNEAFGIGIPSTFGGGTSVFTGTPAGALTDWFTDPNQVFDRAKILSDGGLSADEAVQRLVSDGVESKLAIDAVNEAAGIGIPGNGIPGDPGNVSQFTGQPAGALTGTQVPSVDTGQGSGQPEEGGLLDSLIPDNIPDALSLAGAIPGLVGAVGTLGDLLFGDDPEPPEERQPTFPLNTFSELPPDVQFTNSTSPPNGSLTMTRAAFNSASPFRQSLLQAAIDKGSLTLI